MKLTIEKLSLLRPDDCRDLAKIWPHESETDWQTRLRQGESIYVARFNDRLLASVKMNQTEQMGELHDLLVREPTRRRGVGRYLLEDVQRQNPDIQQWCLFSTGIAEQEYSAVSTFMVACGFTPYVGGWQK